MRCPYCGSLNSRVTNSRNVENGIRRRRECRDCRHRFTTYERIYAAALMVTKRDNRREEFDREKLAAGVRKACAKRPVPAHSIEKVVEDIEGEFQGQSEVATSSIGEAVMERLKDLDRVAYIRYASVYRDFQDIESFEQVVKDLREGGGAQLTLPQIKPGPNRRPRGGGSGGQRQRSGRPRPPHPEAESTPESDYKSEPDSDPAARRSHPLAPEAAATGAFGTANDSESPTSRWPNPRPDPATGPAPAPEISPGTHASEPMESES